MPLEHDVKHSYSQVWDMQRENLCHQFREMQQLCHRHRTDSMQRGAVISQLEHRLSELAHEKQVILYHILGKTMQLLWVKCKLGYVYICGSHTWLIGNDYQDQGHMIIDIYNADRLHTGGLSRNLHSCADASTDKVTNHTSMLVAYDDMTAKFIQKCSRTCFIGKIVLKGVLCALDRAAQEIHHLEAEAMKWQSHMERERDLWQQIHTRSGQSYCMKLEELKTLANCLIPSPNLQLFSQGIIHNKIAIVKPTKGPKVI